MDDVAALKARIAELEAEVARLRGQGSKVRTRMTEAVAMMIKTLESAPAKGMEVKEFADIGSTKDKSRAYYLVSRMVEDGLLRRVGHLEPVRYALVENPAPEVEAYYAKARAV